MRTMAQRYLTERRRRGDITFDTWRANTYILRELAHLYGPRPVGRFDRHDIDRWAVAAGRWAPATRRKNAAVVRGFCEWLVDQGVVTSSPMRGYRPPRLPRHTPRALPHRAVTAALAAAPDQRARLIIVLMVQQGLRCAEVARLDVGDIDLSYRQLRVVGKGGHERFVWITDETIHELKLYLEEHPASHGPLIRSHKHPGQAITPVRVGRIVGAALRAAGVKHRPHDGVSAHALRHTAATDMLRHGAHLRDVQAVLGHAHLVTTERYLPRLVTTLEAAMEGRTYTTYHNRHIMGDVTDGGQP